MAGSEFIIEPGRHDLVMRREFDAPREVVFRAYTDPELIPRWWGPRSIQTIVERMEVETGGQWRYLHRDNDGSEYGFWGVYHEVRAPERIVITSEFEGSAGHVVLETASFDDLGGGRSRLTTRSVFESIEDRDTAMQSGMETGAKEALDRLDELVTQLR